MSLPGGIALYAGYMCFLLILSFQLKYPYKSERDVLNKFFKYVNKGRKRVPMLREHLFSFFAAQPVFPFVALIERNDANQFHNDSIALLFHIRSIFGRRLGTKEIGGISRGKISKMKEIMRQMLNLH